MTRSGRVTAGLAAVALISVVFCEQTAFAQNQGKTWYFGVNAGLSFKTTPPTPLTDGKLSTTEGCATISDADANLLFYTDGITIYNKNHVAMPNGTGLKGNPSSTQSGVIVPDPGNVNKFYHFEVSVSGPSSTYYSKVDMTLAGGLGDVEVSGKSTLLLANTVEGVLAVPGSTGTYWWIITHELGNAKYRAYRLTATGIDTANPVISTVGAVAAAGGEIGHLKANAAGNKVALSSYFTHFSEVLDFNNATGVLTNPRKMPLNACYGIEFSPNGKLLYACAFGGNCYQYDLSQPTEALIVSTAYTLPATGQTRGALQSAPDGKIYVANYGGTALDVINSPNTVGAGSDYVKNGQALGGKTCQAGLPNIISSFVSTGPPQLGALAHASVTATGATLSATVTTDGGAPITERGFYWGTSANPTTNKTVVTGTTGPMSATLSSLAPATTYYYRAFATNSNGTSSIGDGTFTTTNSAPVCGNGAVEGTEQCDDSNTRPADGCSATCQREPGWTCPPSGGACTTSCGDGILTANEACDDGNTASNDGCSSACAIETGYSCFFTTPNLIVNGSFDNGSTGWTSQYTWLAPNSGTLDAANWSVSGNGRAELHGAIPVGFKDAEQSASNKAAFFNGAGTALDALTQSVTLTAGRTYVLSMGIADWSAATPLAQLSISIGGQTLTSNISPPIQSWTRVGGTFVAAATGPAVLKVVDSVTAAGGNDFAVDAVVLREAASQTCGKTCARDADCASTQWCDTTAIGHPPFCTGKLANGTAIPTIPNRDATDPALAGTCTAGAGAAVCVSGLCNPATNTCAGGPSAACTNGNQCATNVCADGACGCNSSTDCAALPGTGCNTATHECLTLVTVTITPSSNPSVYGAEVAFTATLAPAATGTIQFQVDGASFGAPLAVVAGSATSLPVPGLEAGTHSIAALYSGDALHLASSGTLGQLVNKAATTATLASAPNPSLTHEAVVLTATIGSSVPVGAGTVTFLEGTTSLGTAAVSAGVATLAVTSLAAGTHTLTAEYAGGTNFENASAAAVEQVVNKAATTTTLTFSPDPSLHGQPVVVSATVAPIAPAGGLPTGEVTFFEGTTSLGTGTLAGGVATLTLPSLDLGSHTLTASYAGDVDYFGSDATAATHEVQPSCIIAGAGGGSVDPAGIWADGAANPANPCQFCNVAATTTGWTNRPADFACPDDAITCTSDICDGAGACTHPVSVGCLIGEDCVAEHAPAPANECQECNPSLSTTAYVAKAKGSACTDDGSVVTDDVCDGANRCVHPLKDQCLIGGQVYAGGTANPDNSCQVCNSLVDNAGWTHRAAGFPCASDSLACTWDSCDGAGACKHELYVGCLIGGACVATDTTDPANDCQECNPAVSTTAYVAKSRGVACADDGKANTLDVCDGSGACTHALRGQCTIGGATYDAGSANPANPCEWCDPASSVSAFTARVQGFPCTSDALACTSDVCNGTGTCEHHLFTGCLIAEACVGAGALDPANDCKACNPSVSTSEYTVRAQGVSCADDADDKTLDVCDGSGLCTHPLKGQCTIAGKAYDTGAANPANGCEWCNPAASAGSFSPRLAGFPCATDSLSCTSDVCDGAGACTHPLFTGCLVDGACVAEGAADPSGECRACDPRLSTSAYSAKADGLFCSDDGNDKTLDVCDGAGACAHRLKGQCTIEGKTYDTGDEHPTNLCLICDPGASVSAWTERVPEYPCAEDGLSCTFDHCLKGACVHDHFTGCLIGGACVDSSAAQPGVDCRECNPVLSATGWSNKAAGVACTDDGKDNTLDVCTAAAACVHPLKGHCLIDGQEVDEGTQDPKNPCASCDPAANGTAWTLRVPGYPCTSDGLSCTADLCDGSGVCKHTLTAGCVIANACVVAGAVDPANGCYLCDPASSTTAYTFRVGPSCLKACKETSECDSGQRCAQGGCTPLKEAGAACEASAECASNTCTEGKCAAISLSGGGCGCGAGAGGEVGIAAALVLVLATAGRRKRD